MEEIPSEIVILDDKQPKASEITPLFTEDELANIRAIKMTTGDDLIAVVLAVQDKYMLVKRPNKILRIQQDNGQVMIVIIKWQVFSNDEMQALNLDTIISYARVTEEMASFYVKSVLRQMHDDAIEAGAFKQEYVWPDWMDKAEGLQIQ